MSYAVQFLTHITRQALSVSQLYVKDVIELKKNYLMSYGLIEQTEECLTLCHI